MNMEGVDVIYWINLKRAKERRKHMEKILKDPAFDLVKKIRFDALDAIHAMKRLTIPIESVLSINHRVIDKEYACLASHLEAIRMFSNSTFETAIIFEDDVSLDIKPHWRKTIQQVMEEAPKDWDILRLCNGDNGDVKQKETYAKLTYPCCDKYPKSKKMAHCNWGASAYLIRKRAALKLMRLWNGKTYQLPTGKFHVADYLLYDLLTTYVYKNPYFTIRKNNDSQINSRPRTNRLRQSKMKTRKNN